MLKIILLYICFLPTLVLALTWQVDDPCKDKILFQGEKIVEGKLPTVGVFTIDRLLEENIPYRGNESGILAINGSPVGDDAIDIPSDTEMFFYGWCYQVNGFNPNLMIDAFQLNDQTDHVRWYYAYSHYRLGEWVSMCTPAFHRPLSHFCK